MTFIPYLPNDDIPDRSIQEWSEAYKELCALLRAKVPTLKHIDLYYGQETMVDGDGNWLPFRAPAAFLEFQSVAVDELGERKQLITMDVVVRVAHETVQDTNDRSAGQRRAMEFVALLRGVHQALHGAQGDHFGPMSRVGIGRLEAPPYWHFYQQTYRCTILDGSASPEYALREPPLPLEIEPNGGPEVPWDGLVVVRNTDGTYSVELAPGTQEHVLPNVQHTDSDGSTVELPAMAPFTAQLCDQPPPPPPPPNELHEYAASGTYTRPTSVRYMGSWVALVGGGGSGGAGQVASNGGGGGGGQGGARVLRWVPAADMPATVVVSVGAGGAPSKTAGLMGGTTSFGVLFSASGGEGGASGPNATNPGGAAPAGATQIPGMPGGTGTWPASTDGTGGGGWCCPGGGGGIGIRASSVGTAGQGGGVAGVPGGAAGTDGPGGHGTATTAEMLPGLVPTNLHIGTAGGGGGIAPDGKGQAGGDGGPGAGGGGGGCHRNGLSASPGGAGGDGFALVYDMYQ